MLALVAYSLKPVKLLGPCKRTQNCWPTTPSIVGSCWHLLRPFAWTFTKLFFGLTHTDSRKLHKVIRSPRLHGISKALLSERNILLVAEQ